MIIFSVPKPFIGHFATIQKNALESWLEIKPKPTIVLLGNEKGVLDSTQTYKISHIPDIKTNNNDVPLLGSIFSRVQNTFKDDVYMYINADILILNSPVKAIATLKKRFDQFLVIGKRYEMKINNNANKGDLLRLVSQRKIQQKGPSWMDYFIFTPGVFNNIPPFALGRTFWDKWLVWDALKRQIPVVDITHELSVIHQTHSYSFNVNTNKKKVWAGNEALENLKLAGGWSHGADISYASYKMEKNKIYLKKSSHSGLGLRKILDKRPYLWPFFLKIRLFREYLSSIMNKK